MNPLDKYIKEFLDRTIIFYQFYEKTDNDIIYDAILRGKCGFQEFSIYQLGELYSKEQLIPSSQGKIVNSQYLKFHPIDNELKDKSFIVNISSFIYPLRFPFDFDNQFPELYYKFNNERITSQTVLYEILESHLGKEVLITTCWDGMSKFGNFRDVFNIIPLPQNEKEVVNIIKQNYRFERKKLIELLITFPKRLFLIHPEFVKETDSYIKELIVPYMDLLNNELKILDELESSIESNIIAVIENANEPYCDDNPSQRELEEDTLRAMTDGNYDAPIDWDDDDRERYY